MRFLVKISYEQIYEAETAEEAVLQAQSDTDSFATTVEEVSDEKIEATNFTLAAVEPLIRADQTERVLLAERACFGLPKDGVEVIQIRRVLNESQPPVAEHGMDWQRVQRSAKQAEAYPDWAKGSEVNAPPVAAEPKPDPAADSYGIFMPMITGEPTLPTDGTQADTNRAVRDGINDLSTHRNLALSGVVSPFRTHGVKDPVTFDDLVWCVVCGCFVEDSLTDVHYTFCKSVEDLKQRIAALEGSK